MKTRKLFVKFKGKWYVVKYIKNGTSDYSHDGTSDYNSVQFIVSKHINGILCNYIIPLHCCSNIKFKKVKVMYNE